jgi:hypothetical protein
VKESPSLHRFERHDLWLTPPVVQFPDFCLDGCTSFRTSLIRLVAEIRPQQADQAVPAKDDIVGWPDELLIDFPDFFDRTLDSAADTSIDSPTRFQSFLSN